MIEGAFKTLSNIYERTLREYSERLETTVYNMQEYGFTLTHILPYKYRIYDSVLI